MSETRDPGRRSPRSASVIVPVLDGEPILADQLAALAGQNDPGVPWEVIVADNGSRDGTRSLAHDFAESLPRLRLLDASTRRGSSHARNVGAAAATGELLCFCDADDVVSASWLAAHVAAARRHDFAGGPLDVDRLNTARVRTWRPTPRTAAGKSPASFAPSGNMSIWVDVFEKLGGFDEDYLKSHDVELGQRARIAGFHLGWVPEAVVHYRFRDTLAAMARQAFRAGRAAVQMSLDHPQASPLPSWRGEIRAWAEALIRLPLLAAPKRRGTAARILALQAGRLHAIVQFRERLHAASRATGRRTVHR